MGVPTNLSLIKVKDRRWPVLLWFSYCVVKDDITTKTTKVLHKVHKGFSYIFEK